MRIAGETFDSDMSAIVKATKRLKARYHASDTEGAVVSAARSAERDKRDYFVIAGNSYGAFCWRVDWRQSEVTSYVTNSGRAAYRVTSNRDVFKLKIEA
jgi:hypothetical protein